MATPVAAPTIFISYSRQDRSYLDGLLAAVRPALRTVSTIDPWVDQDIASGAHWPQAIEAALAGARAAVLLISNHFLNSRFILDQELPVLLPRHARGELQLFTLYVSKVATPALRVRLTPDDPHRLFDLHAIQAENTPDTPLDAMDGPARNAVFAALATKLHALALALGEAGGEDPGLRRAGRRPLPPGPRGALERPECLIRLRRDGLTLARDLLLPGQRRWASPELPAAEALDRLDCWVPGLDFDGDLLFELLFGRDPDRYRPLLSDPFGEGLALTEPGRWPWRIRLHIDARDPGLQCLPWTRISHAGLPLAASGWTVELAPPAPGPGRPERANHAFIMPGCILLVVPERDTDPRAAAHLRDLQGLLQQLWDRPAPVLVATDAARLGDCLRHYSPRLVYWYGRALPLDGGWGLQLPAATGGTVLDLAGLHALFGAVPPSAVFLNLLGEEAVEALPATAALVREPGCKLLIFQVTPRAQAAEAARSATAWLTGVLSDDQRRDPVLALHGNGHAFAACRTAYQDWDPQLGDSHLDDDLVNLLLDRTRQRARLLQARDDFFDLSSKLRVQCFLAAGTPGNLVEDFPDQVIAHLKTHHRPGVNAQLHRVAALPGDRDPERLETGFRRRLGLAPSQGPAEGLRPPRLRHSREHLLPVLAWTLDGEGTAAERRSVAAAILRWCRERLAPACPDDLRILVLIAFETADAEEHETLHEALEAEDERLTAGQEYRRTAAFRFEALEPLGGVRRQDLRHYFDSEHCSCPDDLRRAYPDRLLGGAKELSFETAVRLIREARDRWQELYRDLAEPPQ